MTTTARPSRGGARTRTGWVLGVACACVLPSVVLLAAVGALVSGLGAAASVLAGGLGALALMVSGTVVVRTVAQVAVPLSLMVALMTFALQVVLALALYAALSRSEAAASLSTGWFAGGLGLAAGSWIVGHVVGTLTARVPLYDLGSTAGQTPRNRPEVDAA